MGAVNFTVTGHGKDAKEAFTITRDHEAWNHGHGGYTGTLAEKGGFKLFALPIDLPTDLSVRDLCETATYFDAETKEGYGGEYEYLRDEGKKDRWGNPVWKRIAIVARDALSARDAHMAGAGVGVGEGQVGRRGMRRGAGEREGRDEGVYLLRLGKFVRGR